MDEPDGLDDNLSCIVRDVAARAPAADLMARLREIEGGVSQHGTQRATFLSSRGIVLNRLGLHKEALGDLYEAKTIFIGANDTNGEMTTCLEIARVFSWRGDSREAALALVDAFATGRAADDDVARALFDAGGVNFEIGRFEACRRLLEKASSHSGTLPPEERARILVLQLQTLVAIGALDEARRRLRVFEASPAASIRTSHLVGLERVRIAVRSDSLPQAEEELARLKGHADLAADGFETIELSEVEAEIAAARGHRDKALLLIRRAIARYADDDLAGREVMARLREADVLTAMGRSDEAARTLLAALRIAAARDLVGHSGLVRAKLGAVGVSPFAWMPGATSTIAINAPDRFVRRRKLGEGGVGSVSAACDLETGEVVALKRLALSNLYDVKERERRTQSARREASAASRIQHPGIGRVHGFVVDANGDGLLVRELVVGPTLREILEAGLPKDGTLVLLTELSQAVGAIHAAGVVHRDLKPENVVLRGERHPVVIDFGASSIGHKQSPGDYSPLYAAPEQIRSRTVDARADLYALGIIAFECFVGERPQRGAAGWALFLAAGRQRRHNLSRLEASGCPSAVGRIIVGMLSDRPSSRPSTVGPFIAALQAPR